MLETAWGSVASFRATIIAAAIAIFGSLCYPGTATALVITLTIHDLTEEQVTVTSSIKDDDALDVSKPDPNDPEFLHFRYGLGVNIKTDSEILYVLMKECAEKCAQSDILELVITKGDDFLEAFFWSDGATNFPQRTEFDKTVNENGKPQTLITYTGGPFVIFKAESDSCEPTPKAANECQASEPPGLLVYLSGLLMLWLQQRLRRLMPAAARSIA